MDAPRPAARPPPPPREPNYGLAMVLIFGLLLGRFYLDYVLPKFSVVPIAYEQADFQNKSANYYDVLNISHDANTIEIELAYGTQISKLSPLVGPGLSKLNFTAKAKVLEVETAFSILRGKSRCLYDFEFLGLGISRYLRCWWNTVKLEILNG